MIKLNLLGKLGKVGKFVGRNASTIELIAGGILVAAGTVKLVKDAEKIAEVNQKVAGNKSYLKEIDQDPDGWKTMDETRKHYILRTTKDASFDYAKVLWKGIGLQLLGGTLVVISHATVTKQLMSVSAALAGTTTAFNNYRKNVIADQGEQKDYEYMTGNVLHVVDVAKDGTVTETTIPCNDGSQAYIPHSFFLSQSEYYTKDNNVNKRNFENILMYLNQKLAVDGLLTENYIRSQCKVPLTIAGQSSCIFYQNEDGTTNQLSFGFERNNEAAQRFRDGSEPDFLVMLQKDDGTPIDSNMFVSKERLAKLNWNLY